MGKMTFKQFLMEVDVGDLQIARQHRLKQQNQAKDTQFKTQMAEKPDQRDIILTKDAKYVIVQMSKEGIHGKKLGSGETTVFPHNSQFKPVKGGMQGKKAFILVK